MTITMTMREMVMMMGSTDINTNGEILMLK